MHQIDTLISLFNQTFVKTWNTELVCCEEEPIYRPADESHPHHRVIFAHGFYASALHEIAHWCVAGEKRRQLEDYGYWYEPDGRSMERQEEFEKVEVKPQAMEWIFSQSADFQFHFSADNIAAGNRPSENFQNAVLEQVHEYLKHGLPERAALWQKALQRYYRADRILESSEFTL